MFLKKVVQYFLTFFEKVRSRVFFLGKNSVFKKKIRGRKDKPNLEKSRPISGSLFQEQDPSPPDHWLEKNTSNPPAHWLDQVSHLRPELWEGIEKTYRNISFGDFERIGGFTNRKSFPIQPTLPKACGDESLPDKKDTSTSWVQYLKGKINSMPLSLFSPKPHNLFSRAKELLKPKKNPEDLQKNTVSLERPHPSMVRRAPAPFNVTTVSTPKPHNLFSRAKELLKPKKNPEDLQENTVSLERPHPSMVRRAPAPFNVTTVSTPKPHNLFSRAKELLKPKKNLEDLQKNTVSLERPHPSMVRRAPAPFNVTTVSTPKPHNLFSRAKELLKPKKNLEDLQKNTVSLERPHPSMVRRAPAPFNVTTVSTPKPHNLFSRAKELLKPKKNPEDLQKNTVSLERPHPSMVRRAPAPFGNVLSAHFAELSEKRSIPFHNDSMNNESKKVKDKPPFTKRLMERKKIGPVKDTLADSILTGTYKSSKTPDWNDEPKSSKRIESFESRKPLFGRNTEQLSVFEQNADIGKDSFREKLFDDEVVPKAKSILRKNNVRYPWNFPSMSGEQRVQRDLSHTFSNRTQKHGGDLAELWSRTQKKTSGFSKIDNGEFENCTSHPWPGLLTDAPDHEGEEVWLLQRELKHLKELEREQEGNFWKK